MAIPSIAALLGASGYLFFTDILLSRAINALYANIGAGSDERNWDTIMAAANPLVAAEAALVTMYQDNGYLLRNANYLASHGYSPAQIELTFRQVSDRLHFTYSHVWSQGTSYAFYGNLPMDELLAQTARDTALPQPTSSVSIGASSFQATLSESGAVSLSVSGVIGSFAAGTNALGDQSSLKEGYLFVTGGSSGLASTASSQYLILGTGGNDVISALGAGSRVNYIQGGAGNDSITGGSGADVLMGGDGNDTITGGGGSDTVTGGNGDDTIIASDLSVIDGGSGNNTVNFSAAVSSANLTDAHLVNVQFITSTTSSLVDLSAQTEGFNFTAGNTTTNLLTGSGNDTYNFSVNRIVNFLTTISGGLGNDILNIGATTTQSINLSTKVSGFETINVAGSTGTVSFINVNGAGITLNYAKLTGDTFLTLGSGGQTLNMTGVSSAASTITGSSGVDTIVLMSSGGGSETLVATGAAMSTMNNIDFVSNFNVTGSDVFQTGVAADTILLVNIGTANLAGNAYLISMDNALNAVLAANTNGAIITISAGTAAGTYFFQNIGSDATHLDSTDFLIKLTGGLGALTTANFIV